MTRRSQHALSPCTLLVLVLIVSLWGQNTRQDKCADLDPQKPIVCLSIPNDKLTVSRRGGEMGIYGSVLASAAIVKPVRATVIVGTPNNPSGVKLDEGAAGLGRNFEIDASHPLRDALLLDVKTSMDNPTSGRLVFRVVLHSDEAVDVLGSPLIVTMDTNP